MAEHGKKWKGMDGHGNIRKDIRKNVLGDVKRRKAYEKNIRAQSKPWQFPRAKDRCASTALSSPNPSLVHNYLLIDPLAIFLLPSFPTHLILHTFSLTSP